MGQQFDAFDALIFTYLVLCLAIALIMPLFERVGEKKLIPIEGDFAKTVIREGDVVQFSRPHSADIGTGKVLGFYPAGDRTMVRIAHLDTPSSNRRISSVPLDDLRHLLASQSDTEAEEIEEQLPA